MRKSDSPPLSARFRAFIKWWLDALQYLIVVGALQYVAQKTEFRALQVLAVVSTILLGVFFISYFTKAIAALLRPLTKWLPERLVDLALLRRRAAVRRNAEIGEPQLLVPMTQLGAPPGSSRFACAGPWPMQLALPDYWAAPPFATVASSS